MVLTGRAALLVLLAAGGVGALVALGASGAASLLVVNLVLVALLGVDAGRAARPGDVRLERSGDLRVRLGQTAELVLGVTNTGSRRLRGTLRDAWTPTAGAVIAGTGGDRAPLDLAPGAAVRLTVRVRPTRRGDRPTDRVTVRSLGPLGLAGRQRDLRADWSVRTLPPFASRRHLPSRLARLRDMDGRQAIAVRAQGSEFDSLREYVPGDDVRSIDWRASARAADVMVRTWRPERDRRVVLVLDSGRTSAARVGDETRLDVLLDASLLLAALAARAGDRVDLLAHDRRTRVRVSGGNGPDLLPRLVEGVATLEPELAETDYRGLVASVLDHVPKRSLVVLLTSLDRAPLEEGLLPALPTLAARHTLVLAAVGDPAPSPPDPAPRPGGPPPPPNGPRPGTSARRPAPPGSPVDAAGAYRRAAQARADLDRAHVSAQLARMGVTVVDAGPDRVAPALADAYLGLKAAGRL